MPVPVVDRVTAAPDNGLPPASRAVTVMTTELVPVLAVIVPAELFTVDCDADTEPEVMLNGALLAAGIPVPLAWRV